MSGDFCIQPVGNLGGDTDYLSPKKPARTTSDNIHRLVTPIPGSSSSVTSRVSFEVTAVGKDFSPKKMLRKVSGE